MTAKQYLNQVRHIDEEITSLLNLVQQTRESLESITQNYDSDGAQTTTNPHRFDRLIELEALVDSKIDEQIALKAEILETITRLKDRRQRIVLNEHYLKMKTWQQVADVLHYSVVHVTRLHGYALNEVQKVLSH